MTDLSLLYQERDTRNRDNLTRTASYLELYRHTVAHPPELPWLLMAHLVSRNAGYMMSDLARTRLAPPAGVPPEVFDELFLFLERANYLIFYDAWAHCLAHLRGLPSPIATPRFMHAAWARYAQQPDERQLVLDLVHNEQHYIEQRVVQNPRFARPLQMITFLEAAGRDKPIALPLSAAEIRVGGFARIEQRIATGRRIFDEVLADTAHRRAILEWALANPHTGDRAVAGGRPTPHLHVAWPLARVQTLDSQIHAPPEPDPSYP